jgi:Mg-chelatase subunit ChlD
MESPGPQIGFLRPAWLLALVALPLLLYGARHSLAGFSRLRTALCLSLRILMLAAVTAALCDLRATAPQRVPFLVFAVDHSGSIADAAWDAADRFVEQAAAAAEGVPTRTVEFAASPRGETQLPDSTEAGATNIALALETACGLVGPHYAPQIVLLSDGNQTEGEALRAAHAARAAGIPISTVPLAVRDVPLPAWQPPPLRALVVETRAERAAEFAAALREAKIGVERRGPEGLPETAAGLAPFGLVALSNVPAAAMSSAQMESLARYVREDRGGLIVLGGDRAFTAGDYAGTALESVLPVGCRPRDEDRRPSLAMVIVVDRSLSMERGGAIALAKEAMRRAVQTLDARDQLGLLAFDEGTRWLSPIRPCSDKADFLRRIDTLTAGGRTDMFPAVEKAHLALEEAFAEVRHMLVLTDGVSHPGDFEALAERIGRSGTTLSTVALGREASRPLLERMAALGHGHFYACDDPAAMPRIFAIETAGAVRRGIRERPFVPRVVGEAPFLAGLDFRQAPPLLGYVDTQAGGEGRVVLAADGDAPLLAGRRHGRGTCVAFTSDVEGRWSAAWLRWPGFRRLWSQVASETVRREEPPGPRPDPDPSLPREFQARSTNHSLLRSIAAATGGVYDPTSDRALIASERTALQTWLLWPGFLAAATALWVLDVAARRFRA